MIIYPSESFAPNSELYEKKLNTYFELATLDSHDSNVDIFSDDGVIVFVDLDTHEGKCIYKILPIVDYICFEALNGQTTKASITTWINSWKSYVQAVRSHTSLFPEKCIWEKYHFEVEESFQPIYENIERLVVGEELKELDDIIRLSYGAELSSNITTTVNIALAEQLIQLVVNKRNADVEIARLESIKLDNADLERQNRALLQKHEQTNGKLDELNNELRKELDLASTQITNLALTVDELQQEKLALEESTRAEKTRFDLQVVQLQEEIEAVYVANTAIKSSFESAKVDMQSFEERLTSSDTEKELLGLQILQIQEELESACTENIAIKRRLESEIREKQSHKACFKNSEKEKELVDLQVLQLQEELETICTINTELKSGLSSLEEEQRSFKENLKRSEVENKRVNLQVLQLQQELQASFKQAASEKLAEQADSGLATLNAELELSKLQVLQLQEELEFYFEKAKRKTPENCEKELKQLQQNKVEAPSLEITHNNTIGLIGKLIGSAARE